MEGFTYQNIFDTKGIEYIVVIVFLLTLIPFWMLLNRKVAIKRSINSARGIITANTLNIPRGLFYSPNHTWTHLEKSGEAKVGMDDLLSRIVGEVGFSNIRKSGERIVKGDLLVAINRHGKLFELFSPISGEIIGINSVLINNPELLLEDPYSKGWMYKIKPSQWIAETSSYYIAEEATNWSLKELERFKDFMASIVERYANNSTQVVLQDGGELTDGPLTELPQEVWHDFQKNFLNVNI